MIAAARAVGLALLLLANVATAQTAGHETEQVALPPIRSGNVASLAIEGAKDLADYALEFLGVKYRFGGATPQQGFDCSGLIQYVFQQFSGVELPRTSRELSRIGENVDINALVPGDLVFFNTRRFAFSHVGIYLGGDQFIHAPRKGKRVQVAKLESSYWQRRFNGARRLIGVVPGLSPQFVNDIQALASEVSARPAPDAGESAAR